MIYFLFQIEILLLKIVINSRFFVQNSKLRYFQNFLKLRFFQGFLPNFSNSSLQVSRKIGNPASLIQLINYLKRLQSFLLKTQFI